MIRWLLVLALLLPGAAFASNGWKKGPDSTSSTVTGLTGSLRQAYFHVDSTASAGTYSNVLATGGMKNVNFVLIPDQNQVTASPTCELRVFATSTDGGTAVTTENGLPQMSADTDGDGVQNDATMNGVNANRRTLSFVAAPGVTIKIEALPGSGQQCLLWVTGSSDN